MSLDVHFVPISIWPGRPTAKPKEATFRARFNDTLTLLEFELSKLNARNITVQAFFTRADIRNDGWPKSSAVPSAPGLILSFEARQKRPAGDWVWTEFSFPCDTFTAYDDNLRAIALALEALRKIDRYGVTPGHEQYTGWAKLPPPSGAGQAFEEMSRSAAASFISEHAGRFATVSGLQWRFTVDQVLNGMLTEAYRAAAARLHPDNKQTGNHELFVRLQKAKEILERGRHA